jgi:serine protease
MHRGCSRTAGLMLVVAVVIGLVACAGGGGGSGGGGNQALGTVVVEPIGDGAGQVTSNPGGIACDSACTRAFPLGSSLTLTATAAPGSLFAGWEGACSGMIPQCTLNVSQNVQAIALFGANPLVDVAPGAAIAIDASLDPGRPAILDGDGRERPVARMVSASGVVTDFLLGELLIAGDDDLALAALLARWGGTVLQRAAGGNGVPTLHRVLLDPSAAQVEALLAEAVAGVDGVALDMRVSSREAAQLLAVILVELRRSRLSVMPNFVLQRSAIIAGSATEAPVGDDDYNPDPFTWTYMRRGGVQDIGVAAAWQALARANRLGNRVRMLILDGGFSPTPDFPADPILYRPNLANSESCGGRPCPWHGTNVVSAAMARVDDGFGGAGPAGPVAELTAVNMGGDFFETIASVVAASLALTPDVRIINISAGFELDVGWEVASRFLCLFCPTPGDFANLFFEGLARTNRLVFAAAGNQGKDVDAGGLIEGFTLLPCEATGVICVAGLAYDSNNRAEDSNFGSRGGSRGSVDIYAPYQVWVGPDPLNPGNRARLIAGTSLSSPFVAGVAALVWAAAPSLTAEQVWDAIRATAHEGVGGTLGNRRRVNAYRAVASVLGGSPPSVSWDAPARVDLGRQVAITVTVTDPEYVGGSCPPIACPLTFTPTPERVVGNVAYYRFRTPGPVTISVASEDAVGQTGVATATIDVINSPPTVSLELPANPTSHPEGVPITFRGTILDINEGPDPGPARLGCRWTSSVAADLALPLECNGTYIFQTQGPRVITLSGIDRQGLTASASVSVVITAPPSNLPPEVGYMTTYPAYNFEVGKPWVGYTWSTAFRFTGSARDPEGDVPIAYRWIATSYAPGLATDPAVFRSEVVIGTEQVLDWEPQNTPTLFTSECVGDAYWGQLVRLRVEATDALGNVGFRNLREMRIYRCIFG